jgi:hypothetical protein
VVSYSALDVYKTTLLSAELVYSKGKDGNVETIPLFTSVSVEQSAISSENAGAGKVSFTIRLIYDEIAFAWDTVVVDLRVPSETTSDAYRNSPRNIFTTEEARSTDQQEQGGDDGQQ